MSLSYRAFVGIKFKSPDIKAKFLEDYRAKSTPIIRISIILGIFAYLGFLYVDFWALPLTQDFAFKVRVFMVLPGLCLIFLLSLLRPMQRFIELLMASCGILGGLGIVLMLARANPSEIGYDTYYGGLVLVNVWVATFARMRFWLATFVVLLNDIIYFIVAIYFQNYFSGNDPQHRTVFFVNCSFILTTNFIAVLSCRIMEYYARIEFLQSEQLLRDKNQLIANEKAMSAAHEQLSNQQLSLANASRLAALGEMAAGVAHEVNNPLSIIMGRIEIINRNLEAGIMSSERLKGDFEKVFLASQRIAKIVGALRSFSRDGKGDEFHKESLVKIVEETVSLCQEKFHYNGVGFSILNIPNVYVRCRATQISQVLLNLLNNAFDATTGLSHRLIQLSFEPGETSVSIRVSDSGHGVPDEIKSKIMQPFFTTKGVGQGTGLGLSISKGIIDEHGGELVLESSAQGAVFRFTLPIYTEL